MKIARLVLPKNWLAETTILSSIALFSTLYLRRIRPLKNGQKTGRLLAEALQGFRFESYLDTVVLIERLQAMRYPTPPAKAPKMASAAKAAM